MRNESVLHFKNGQFKIMQITDTQELPVFSPDTIKLLHTALDQEKPDLVVLTGDQIKGHSHRFHGKQSKQRVAQAIAAMVEPMESRGIPFAVTFGNHDEQSGIDNATQMEIYRTFSHCLPVQEFGAGTGAVLLFDELQTKPLFVLYILDSNGDAKGGGYEPIEPQKIDWFRKRREELSIQGEYLPAIVFQHIPLPEYYCVLQQVTDDENGAIRAYRTHKDEFYILPKENRVGGEFFLEPPCAPDVNTGAFAAFREKGDVLAVFCGHDHKNSFYRNYQGVDLGYTQSSGFHEYGPGIQRGVRVFTLDEKNLHSYQTHTLTYQQLFGNKVSHPFLDWFFRVQPTSMDQALHLLPRALGFLFGGAVLIGILLFFILH